MYHQCFAGLQTALQRVSMNIQWCIRTSLNSSQMGICVHNIQSLLNAKDTTIMEATLADLSFS